jgi:fatty acid desaturase
MTDNSLRHTIALLATLICAAAWGSGYISGTLGWWWTLPSVLIMYGVVYKIVNKPGGGGHH